MELHQPLSERATYEVEGLLQRLTMRWRGLGSPVV
jgi:hypothetical protein